MSSFGCNNLLMNLLACVRKIIVNTFTVQCVELTVQPVAFITLLLQSVPIVSRSFNVEDGGIVSCAAYACAGGW